MRITIAVATIVFLVAANLAIAGSPNEADLAWQKGNYARVLEIVQPLAKGGDKDSETLLGSMYALGRGVPQNEGVAISWWSKSGQIAQGEYTAGLLLLQGSPVPSDESKALYWFEKSAVGNYWPSQVMTATMYMNGRGTVKNLDKGRYWFGKAADQGVTAAQMSLAGLDDAQHEDEAFKWLIVLYRRCLAGELNIPASTQKLAYCAKLNNAANLVKTKLTPAQSAEGQRLASAWLAKDRAQLDPKEDSSVH